MQFCPSCKEPIQGSPRFCPGCGRAVTALLQHPEPGSVLTDQPALSLWNPNAAVNWSFIFSAAFGSYIHAINWRTLGEIQKERTAKRWFYFTIVTLLIPGGLGFAALVLWYFISGTSQAKYVKDKFGSTYQRRPWGRPLLIGLGAYVVYIGYVLLFLFVTRIER